MHRDMDLVRQILLKMDEHPNGFAPPKIEVPGYTDEQIGYHVALMGEAGLIKCVDVTPYGARGPVAIPSYLRWEGYEFIAASKDDGIWNKGKSTVMARAGAIGFEIIKAVLTAEIRRQLGLP